MAHLRKEKLYAERANPFDHHFSQFIEAAKVGELKDVISYCKSFPNNINLADESGLTAVMYAANYGHYNILKPLVTERQAITNFREPNTDKTALMFAASNGHTRCIETLIQGKADKDLKDAQGNNAAYYATHYGHGNNKIIARLLSIQFPNQGYQQNGNHKHHHHHHQSTSTSFNTSIESANLSFQPQERYNALLAQNQSLTEENLNYFSSNNSSNDNFSNGRRFSVEINQNSLNDILNRTPQKPRPIFKTRQRRLSPNTHSHTHMMDYNKERQRRHLYNLGQMNQIHNQFSHVNNLTQLSQHQSSYNQQCNSPLNEVRNNLKNFSFDFDKNCLPGLSLNGNPSSPNAKNYSSDQLFNQLQKSNYYQVQNNSVFESLQDSNNNDPQLSPGFKERSKIDPNCFNVELLLNGTIDSNLNRGRPRNSTFISNNANSSGNSNHQSDSEHSSQMSDGPLNDFENEERFSGFVVSIEEFLKKYELERFGDLFIGKNIDLFTFLSFKETDLKELGINDPDDLASIIAGQLNYQELIGISSAKGMNFCIYLSHKLEQVKRELNRSKKENSLIKMNLNDSRILNKSLL